MDPRTRQKERSYLLRSEAARIRIQTKRRYASAGSIVEGSGLPPDTARLPHGHSILLMGVTVKVDKVDQIRPAGSYHQQLRRDCYAEEPTSQEDKPETFRRIIARFCCSSDPARRPASIPRMSYQRQLAGAAHGLHFHRAESSGWPRGLRRVLRGPGLPGNQVRLRPSRYLFSGV